MSAVIRSLSPQAPSDLVGEFRSLLSAEEIFCYSREVPAKMAQRGGGRSARRAGRSRSLPAPPSCGLVATKTAALIVRRGQEKPRHRQAAGGSAGRCRSSTLLRAGIVFRYRIAFPPSVGELLYLGAALWRSPA